MQPYYQDASGITLYLGDCREVLPQIGKCNLILSDPPYGEINADRDWKIKPPEYAGLLKACATPTTGAALFCSMRFAFDLHPAMVAAKWRYWTNFVWEKDSGGLKGSDTTPICIHEHVLCYIPNDAMMSHVTFNGYEAGEQGMPWIYRNKRGLGDTVGVYTRKRVGIFNGHSDGKRWITTVLKGTNKVKMPVGDRTAHPTQKPLETVSKLVILLTNPGDLVLDPFLGSGTTAHACKKLGRTCIGIEKNEAYIAMAIKRLSQEVMVFS
jgi:site-specific DNA-methyltransferase (adenine-specific)